MNQNWFGTGTVGTGTNEIKPKTGTGSVRFEVIGTVVNLTEPAAYWTKVDVDERINCVVEGR